MFVLKKRYVVGIIIFLFTWNVFAVKHEVEGETVEVTKDKQILPNPKVKRSKTWHHRSSKRCSARVAQQATHFTANDDHSENSYPAKGSYPASKGSYPVFKGSYPTKGSYPAPKSSYLDSATLTDDHVKNIETVAVLPSADGGDQSVPSHTGDDDVGKERVEHHVEGKPFASVGLSGDILYKELYIYTHAQLVQWLHEANFELNIKIQPAPYLTTLAGIAACMLKPPGVTPDGMSCYEIKSIAIEQRNIEALTCSAAFLRAVEVDGVSLFRKVNMDRIHASNYLEVWRVILSQLYHYDSLTQQNLDKIFLFSEEKFLQFFEVVAMVYEHHLTQAEMQSLLNAENIKQVGEQLRGNTPLWVKRNEPKAFQEFEKNKLKLVLNKLSWTIPELESESESESTSNFESDGERVDGLSENKRLHEELDPLFDRAFDQYNARTLGTLKTIVLYLVVTKTLHERPSLTLQNFSLLINALNVEHENQRFETLTWLKEILFTMGASSLINQSNVRRVFQASRIALERVDAFLFEHKKRAIHRREVFTLDMASFIQIMSQAEKDDLIEESNDFNGANLFRDLLGVDVAREYSERLMILNTASKSWTSEIYVVMIWLHEMRILHDRYLKNLLTLADKRLKLTLFEIIGSYSSIYMGTFVSRERFKVVLDNIMRVNLLSRNSRTLDTARVEREEDRMGVYIVRTPFKPVTSTISTIAVKPSHPPLRDADSMQCSPGCRYAEGLHAARSLTHSPGCRREILVADVEEAGFNVDSLQPGPSHVFVTPGPAHKPAHKPVTPGPVHKPVMVPEPDRSMTPGSDPGSMTSEPDRSMTPGSDPGSMTSEPDRPMTPELAAHKPVKPKPGHKPVKPGPSHKPVKPGPDHKPMKPGSDRPVKPGPSHKPVKPGPGHKPVKPGSGHKPMKPGSGHKPVKPGSGHKPVKPGSDHKPVKPGSGHKPVKPGSGHKPVKPGSGHKPIKPGPGHKSVKPGPSLLDKLKPEVDPSDSEEEKEVTSVISEESEDEEASYPSEDLDTPSIAQVKVAEHCHEEDSKNKVGGFWSRIFSFFRRSH